MSQEFVPAEGASAGVPRPFAAPTTNHVGAIHDCGIRVGEFFQADPTLRLLVAERGKHKSANVRVSHLFRSGPYGGMFDPE